MVERLLRGPLYGGAAMLVKSLFVGRHVDVGCGKKNEEGYQSLSSSWQAQSQFLPVQAEQRPS